MKTKYMLLFVLLIQMSAHSLLMATNIYGGITSGTWLAANSPYIVHGEVLVASGTSLVIEPGTTIRFVEHARMRIEGNIQAMGTQTDSIRIEYDGTNAWYNHTSPSPGWWGIAISNYNATMDTSRFMYCDISGFRQNSATSDTTSGLLNVYASYLYFSHNHVHHNVAESPSCGISLGNSIAEIAYNELEENIVSGGILRFLNATISLHHNRIHHNYNDLQSNSSAALSLTPCIWSSNNSVLNMSYNEVYHHINVSGYGGALVASGNISLYHNHFYDNHAYKGGGAIYLSREDINAAEVIDIDGNLFANNSDSTNVYVCGITDGGGGAFITQVDCKDCKTIVHNNIFANNQTGSWGGGLRLHKVNGKVMNNHFVNNLAHTNGGALHLFNSPGKQIVSKNNIFYGNQTEDTIFYHHNTISCGGLYGTMIFEYNTIDYPYNDAVFAQTQDSMLSYNNNTLTSSPGFITPTTLCGLAQNGASANWALSSNSPCINTGDIDTTNCAVSLLDYLEHNRFEANHIDIGAIEYRYVEAIKDDTKATLFAIFPNPTQSQLSIQLQATLENVQLSIWNLWGEKISEDFVKNMPNNYSINTSAITEGIYLLQISTGEQIFTQKFIKKD